MEQSYKRGQIRSMAQYDRGIWDWSILEGCFANSKISPTDIDGCVERRGRKLIIETKLPGIAIPQGQMQTLLSFVADGHTVLIIWGEDDAPQRIRLIKPFGFDKEWDAGLDEVRLLVSQWYEMANAKPMQCSDAAKVARAYWRRKGAAYCDIMMAEWMRLDEQRQSQRGATPIEPSSIRGE